MATVNLPLYEQWHNCDPNESGKPLCQLPTLKSDKGYPYTKHPQTMGCSLRELQNGRRLSPLHRSYDVFVVCDSPDRDADRAGMPMSGDSAEVLVALLNNALFDQDRTYITAYAKCVPPPGRKVAASEYTACRRHLEYELHKYKPSVVIVLGSEALRVFNLQGSGGITSIHGTAYDMEYPHWSDKKEPNFNAEAPLFKVIPTFTPKQFLATGNPKYKNLIQEDLNKARGLLADNVTINNAYYKAAFKVIEIEADLKAMVDTIKENKVFAFDTESPDLHFMTSPLMLLQISCGIGKTWVLPFYQHNPEHDPNVAGTPWMLKPVWSNGRRDVAVEYLRQIFENESIAKCAHNFKYDLNVIKRHLGLKINGWLWDTQIMHHILHTIPPHGLKELADMEFFTGNYEGPVRDIVGHGRKLIKTYDWVPDDILWQYGATDAEVTYRLLELYYPEITRKENFLKLYTEESLPTIRTLADAEWNGNHLNVPNILALGKSMDAEMETLLVECREMTHQEFSPTSPDDVAEAMIKRGHKELVQNPKKVKGVSTDKNVLLKIEETGDPLAKKIVRYRNRKKFKGTYVDQALSEIDPDGRVRYGFNITGTVSGRLSCTFLHQIPRSDKDDVKAGRLVMRDMIDEIDDYVLYYADYSQIELRVFAQQTGEQALLDVLLDPKGDVHRFTASAALGIAPEQVSEFNRQQIGKPMNFGIIYGSKGASLAKLEYEDPATGRKRLIGDDLAYAVVRNYRDKYPKIDHYLTITPDLARMRGSKVLTPFGREIFIPDLNSKEAWKRAEAERSATNVSIQSPAGAVAIRTMCWVEQILDDLEVGSDLVRLVNNVHDSIAYGVHKSMVEWFDGVFKSIAQRPIPELGNMSFPVNTGWGRTWAEAERAAH